MLNKELSISVEMPFVQRLRESIKEEGNGMGRHSALETKKSYKPNLFLDDAQQIKVAGSSLK